MSIQPNTTLPKTLAIKEYLARVNQSGTSVPFANIVLIDTYDTQPFWMRTARGEYEIHNTGNEFTLGRTIMPNLADFEGTGTISIPITIAGVLAGWISYEIDTVNVISVWVTDTTGTYKDLSELIGLTNIFVNFKTIPINIRK